MTIGNFSFYLQNRLIQTSQTRGQLYSDTSPVSIPCLQALHALDHLTWVSHQLKTKKLECFKSATNNILKIIKNLVNPSCSKVMPVSYITQARYMCILRRV
jgi:hypothetical protein